MAFRSSLMALCSLALLAMTSSSLVLRGGCPDHAGNDDIRTTPKRSMSEHAFYTTSYLNHSTFPESSNCPHIGMGNEYTDEYWANRERDLADAEDNDNHIE
jgi:hypothetical protein